MKSGELDTALYDGQRGKGYAYHKVAITPCFCDHDFLMIYSSNRFVYNYIRNYIYIKTQNIYFIIIISVRNVMKNQCLALYIIKYYQLFIGRKLYYFLKISKLLSNYNQIFLTTYFIQVTIIVVINNPR